MTFLYGACSARFTAFTRWFGIIVFGLHIFDWKLCKDFSNIFIVVYNDWSFAITVANQSLFQLYFSNVGLKLASFMIFSWRIFSASLKFRMMVSEDPLRRHNLAPNFTVMELHPVDKWAPFHEIQEIYKEYSYVFISKPKFLL